MNGVDTSNCYSVISTSAQLKQLDFSCCWKQISHFLSKQLWKVSFASLHASSHLVVNTHCSTDLTLCDGGEVRINIYLEISQCLIVFHNLSINHPLPSGPPRVSERVAHRQSVRLGRTMKLPCPVEGDPPPLIMWTKDGRNIHSGWTRFRVLQHALRIKEVETEDAGTYICKATNGFGSVNINYTLIVIGKCCCGGETPIQTWTK